MTTARTLDDLLAARRAALRSLDALVRAELFVAADSWGWTDGAGVTLTVYDQVYGRTPRLGGHWTLFRAALTPDGQEVASLTVALEFADLAPADFWVCGVDEAIAGGCSATALREALAQCGGPLRQVTPLVSVGPDGAPVYTALLVPYTAGPVGSLN